MNHKIFVAILLLTFLTTPLPPTLAQDAPPARRRLAEAIRARLSERQKVSAKRGGASHLQGSKDAGDYWITVDLPEITQDQKKAYCTMSLQEWQDYYDWQYEEAQAFSERLEDYIRKWSRGEKPAQVPASLFPPSLVSKKMHSWTLLTPEEVIPEKQWFYYPAREEPALKNFSKLYQNSAATHVTYLKLPCCGPIQFGTPRRR